ncbi:TPA: homoserine dehydrogenase [archaeon]|nr:homoserine dehydrogenase [Candidatus Naiadarchaeales archaeon SRR2090153.bin461]
MREVKLFIVGLGNVGGGLVKLMKSLEKEIERKYSTKLKVVGAVDIEGSAFSKEGLDLDEILKTKNKGSIKNYPKFGSAKNALEQIEENWKNFDVLVEVSTTNLETAQPALDHIRNSLEKGKHVVTSNKGPIALHYDSLIKLAKKNGVILGFEACVAGVIPVIRILRGYLALDKVQGINAIVNGTCNFILGKMSEGISFEKALKEAQEKGYAEADPALDVTGMDSAAKLVILNNIVSSRQISLKDVKINGIENLSGDARNTKLIASLRNGDAKVQPEKVQEGSFFASVNGVLNAIEIETEIAGPLKFSGRGAGGRETAYAVLADILKIAAENRI